MTNQALGAAYHFFTGEVRDIRDPDKQGKMKIHIHGHSNQQMPPTDDAQLHWAHPFMNNSPSTNGIGKTSHYLPGSTVVGFWLDPLTKQIPIILGSMHKAGVSQSSSGQEPPSFDGTYRSPPGGPKGKALDPSVLANVTKITQQDLWTKTDFNWGVSSFGNQQNLGAQGSQDNAQKRAKAVKAQNNPQWLQPTNATVASATPQNILTAMKSIDPSNKSGPIPKSLDAMIQLNQLAASTSPGGAASAAAGALGQAMQIAAEVVGMSSVMSATGALAAGVSNSTVSAVINQALIGLLSNTNVGALSDDAVAAANATASLIGTVAGGAAPGTPIAALIANAAPGSSFNLTVAVPGGGTVQQTITVTGSPPGVGPTANLTGQELLTISTQMAGTTANVITTAIQSGNTAQLIGLVESLIDGIALQNQMNIANNAAAAAGGGGGGGNPLQSMFSIIPQMAPVIQAMVSGLANTLNNPQFITQLQTDAARTLSIGKIAWNIGNMFQGTEAEQAAGVAAAAATSVGSQAVGSSSTVTSALATITSTRTS